jgi:hypothetical protein
MSEENIEIARRYLEENFPRTGTVVGVGCRILGGGRRLLPGSQDPGSEAMPRARGDRRLPYGVPCGLGFRYVVNEARAIGDDRVLVHGEIRPEGRASGVALEGDTYSCFWLRNGRFFRVEGHLTLAGALRALGLSGDSLEAAGLSE